MPAAKRVSKKTTVVLESVIDPVPVSVVEPVVAAVAAPAPVKKQKKQPKKGKVSQPGGALGAAVIAETNPNLSIFNDIASVPASESYSVPCDSSVGFEDDLRLRREHIRDFDK